jgi:hypothetical protein
MTDTLTRAERAMRAITVQQPWASAIAHPDGKRVENRRWTTSWRGALAIHAGQGWDPAGARDPEVLALFDVERLDPADFPRGVIVARARLDSIHESAGGFCCPWGDPRPGMFHLCLADVVALRRPVARTGALGLVRLTSYEEAEVRSG